MSTLDTIAMYYGYAFMIITLPQIFVITGAAAWIFAAKAMRRILKRGAE